MKYNTEVIIHLPINRTIELFDNPDNLKRWMPDLVSIATIEGKAGEVGTKSKMHFKMGKRDLIMIETIEELNLPDNLIATYEASGVWNRQNIHFSAVNEHTTRYITENEFKFKKLSMKIFSWLMPKAFKKQSQLYMQNFKDFAENQGLE